MNRFDKDAVHIQYTLHTIKHNTIVGSDIDDEQPMHHESMKENRHRSNLIIAST
jgi:hypothetical protein